jgi:hypothetical protein
MSVQAVRQAAVHPSIQYPSYKSFDEFIDVKRLRSLDAFLTEKIRSRIKTQQDSLFLNYYRLDTQTPYEPGVREIWLTKTKPDILYNYFDLDKPELWHSTPDAEEFAPLVDFIRTLPFQATGRILIIYDDAGKAVPAHCDHTDTDICHEFLWMRTNFNKPFYILNHKTGEKCYVESHSAWFDSVNQFHGSDAVEGLSFSISVDGIFTDDFRQMIPQPPFNPASTPAFWSAQRK